VSHRRDQKEKLRREREERERKARDAERRKKLVGYGAGGLLALAAVVVLLVLVAGGGDGEDAQAANVFPDGGSFPEQRIFEVRPAASAAGCELRTVKGAEATHTTSLEEKVKYKTNPPTVGRHFEVPAEDGIYGDPPQDETVPHAMEHGRVVFWVKPSLAEAQRADIAALVRDDEYQLLLIPRSKRPHAVAATAWNGEPAPNGTGRMLLCDEVNDRTFDALAAFRDEHRSQGAEPVP
jgi:hypothetical protein